MVVRSKQEVARLLLKWASGEMTLKEIKGYSDEELFAIARIAYFFMMQGKNDEARVLFEGLIAIDPRNDYYYRALGVIFQKLGDSERAIRQFSYAIQINPAFAHSYVNRAEVYIASERYKEAKTDLQKALDVMNIQDQALSRKAWALYRMVTSQNR